MQRRSWSKYWGRWQSLCRRLRHFRRHRVQSHHIIAKKPPLSSIKPPTPPSEASLNALPPSVVQRVFDYLQAPDKACLALTCKHFHGLFSSVFEHTDLRSSTRVAGEKQTSRTELLMRLEDASWQYCMKCLTLHRQNESPTGIDPGPGTKTEVPSTIRSIEKVQVCPCVTMTRWQRFQLMRKLESRCIQRSDNNFLLDGMCFYCALSERGHYMTTHECAITDHPHLTDHTIFALELVSESPGDFQYRLLIEHNIRLRPRIFHSDTDTRMISHMEEIMAYIKACHGSLAPGASEWRQTSGCNSSRQVILEEQSPNVEYLPGTEAGHLVIRASQHLSLTAPPFTFDFRCLPFGPCII